MELLSIILHKQQKREDVHQSLFAALTASRLCHKTVLNERVTFVFVSENGEAK